MDSSLIKELKLRLATIKQDLAKIEDENGLNFWTGSKYQIEELKSEIYSIEAILNKNDALS
jgi:uncharacterized HAD superfamily protein